MSAQPGAQVRRQSRQEENPQVGALGAPGCCVPGVPPSISGTVKALRISGGLLTPPTCLESMRRTSPKGAGLCVLEALRWLRDEVLVLESPRKPRSHVEGVLAASDSLPRLYSSSLASVRDGDQQDPRAHRPGPHSGRPPWGVRDSCGFLDQVLAHNS